MYSNVIKQREENNTLTETLGTFQVLCAVCFSSLATQTQRFRCISIHFSHTWFISCRYGTKINLQRTETA